MDFLWNLSLIDIVKCGRKSYEKDNAFVKT